MIKFKVKNPKMMGSNLKNLKKKLNYNQWSSGCYRSFMIIQYCWFKIIGLSPWALNTSTNSDENIICYFSWIGTFYSLLLVIIYAGIVNINYIYYSLYSNPDSEQVLSLVLYERLQFVLSHSLIVLILIFIIRHKSLISVLNRFNSTAKNLRKFVDLNKELDCTIYLTLITDFLIIISLMLVRIYYNYPVINIVGYAMECFFKSGVIIQFVIFLNIISKHFQGINSSISKLDNAKINTDQVNSACVINMVVSVVEPDLYVTDDNIIAYVNLYKICDELKKFYGLPILIGILNLSVEILCFLYFTTWNSIRSIRVMPQETIEMIIIVLRNIFLLIVLTSNVTKTINESQETNKIIDVLMLRPSANQETKDQLTKFSNIISHFNVKFIACDMLPLDRRLLLNIFTTITIYFITILLIRINLSPYIE